MNKELLAASILDNAVIDFARSSGPGGQNVNKVNTKVIARVPLCTLAGLDDKEMELVRTRLAGRINAKDEIVVSVQEERSQVQNRERALNKLIALIVAAARRIAAPDPHETYLAPRKKENSQPNAAAPQSRDIGRSPSWSEQQPAKRLLTATRPRARRLYARYTKRQ